MVAAGTEVVRRSLPSIRKMTAVIIRNTLSTKKPAKPLPLWSRTQPTI